MGIFNLFRNIQTKSILVAAALFTTLLTSTSFANPIVIAIDIDGTIVDDLNLLCDANLPIEDSEVFFYTEDEQSWVFRIHPDAIALVEWLSELPDVKIVFFSAGMRSRNHALLNYFQTSKKKTLLQVAEGRCLSREDIVIQGNLKNDIYYKDLNSIHTFYPELYKNADTPSQNDLNESTLIIEDNIHIVLESQMKNVIWLYQQYEIAYEWESLKQYFWDSPLSLSDRTDPDRLKHARRMLEAALRKSKNENIPLNEALYQIQWKKKESASNGPLYSTHHYVGHTYVETTETKTEPTLSLTIPAAPLQRIATDYDMNKNPKTDTQTDIIISAQIYPITKGSP